MIAGQPFTQVGVFIGGTGSLDAPPAGIFVEDVGRKGHQTQNTPARDIGTGMDQGNGAAVAMSDQDRIANAEMIENGRQHVECFVMHESGFPGQVNRIGVAISPAAEHESAATACGRDDIGNVTPQTGASKTLMQKNQNRVIDLLQAQPAIFNPLAADIGEAHIVGRAFGEIFHQPSDTQIAVQDFIICRKVG